jgi:hypothetical protein
MMTIEISLALHIERTLPKEKNCIQHARSSTSVVTASSKMSAKKQTKKAKLSSSTIEHLEPLSVETFKDFLLSRAYDIISEGN